jgi:hypothetical protein
MVDIYQSMEDLGKTTGSIIFFLGGGKKSSLQRLMIFI